MINITAKRRELLQAIDDGAVEEKYPILPEPAYSELDRGPGASFPPGRRIKVTAAVRQLADAGLVKLEPRLPNSHYKAPRLWTLTDSGRSALATGRHPE